MKVDVFHGDRLIGHADLTEVDPAMGVAAGVFEPTLAYCPALHAVTVDGVVQESSRWKLSVRSPEFGLINCEGAGIDDASDSLGEIEITLLGIPHPAYDAYFRTDPIGGRK